MSTSGDYIARGGTQKAPGIQREREESAFVDTLLADPTPADITAQSDLGRQIHIVLLDRNVLGIALISAASASRSDICAIHLIANGVVGG